MVDGTYSWMGGRFGRKGRGSLLDTCWLASTYHMSGGRVCSPGSSELVQDRRRVLRVCSHAMGGLSGTLRRDLRWKRDRDLRSIPPDPLLGRIDSSAWRIPAERCRHHVLQAERVEGNVGRVIAGPALGSHINSRSLTVVVKQATVELLALNEELARRRGAGGRPRTYRLVQHRDQPPQEFADRGV